MVREFKAGQVQDEHIVKVYLNDSDDYIYINDRDTSVVDRFAEFIKWLEEKEKDISTKQAEFEKQYGKDIITHDEDGEIDDINVDALVAFCKVRREIYLEATDQIDRILGQDAIKKFFRVSYEINPDFVPDDECLYDFIEAITPVLNQVFEGRAKRISEKYNRDRKGGKRSKYRSKQELIQSYMGK